MTIVPLFNVLLMIIGTDCYMHTDTADDIFIAATVPLVNRFGWTTCGAVVQKQISQNVNTADGGATTVNTTIIGLSLSGVPRVLLRIIDSS